MDLTQLETPRMLYRAGNQWATDFGPMDLRVVQDGAELEQAVADGWHVTAEAARDAAAEPAAPKAPPEQPPENPDTPPAAPTRADLEREAAELGIKFDGRWGDKRLAEAIAAKKG